MSQTAKKHKAKRNPDRGMVPVLVHAETSSGYSWRAARKYRQVEMFRWQDLFVPDLSTIYEKLVAMIMIIRYR
jgi:hypothetical protein